MDSIYQPCGRYVLCSISVWLSSTEMEKYVLKKAEFRVENFVVELVNGPMKPSVGTCLKGWWVLNETYNLHF